MQKRPGGGKGCLDLLHLAANGALVRRALGVRDLALLLLDVCAPLLGLDGAEDDVHLLERAALGFWDEPTRRVSTRVYERRQGREGTHSEKMAMPPMLIVANMKNIL